MEYGFNTVTGVHSLWFEVNPHMSVRGDAQVVIDALDGLRDNADVRGLVEWLSRQ